MFLLVFFGLLLLDILTFGLVSFFILGFCLMIQMLAYCMVLEKMGEKGWKAFIPFYNEYLVFKHIWGAKFFTINLICSVLNSYFIISKMLNATSFNNFFYIATSVAVCMFTIMYYLKLAAAFGRSRLFGLGLIILPPLFIMILAFDGSQFQGDNNYPAF